MDEHALVGTHAEQVALRSTPAGVSALGTMTDTDFNRSLDQFTLALKRVERIKAAILEPGTDYDVIPGTPKPTLLQPGAQKLCFVAGLVPEFTYERIAGDGSTTTAAAHYIVKCRLHLRSTDGPVVAEGLGSASTSERKHRYRHGERACPACKKVGTIIKGKEEYGGGWLCFAKKGGCGAKWPDDAPEIVGQEVGDIVNPDPLDLDNTCIKMGAKRAFVAATLLATSSSGIFTQDMEDIADPGAKEAERKRLIGEIANIFEAASVKSKSDRITVARELMGEQFDPSRCSLAELVALVSKMREKYQMEDSGEVEG